MIKSSNNTVILLLVVLAALLCGSCAGKKKIAETTTPVEQKKPTWHTTLVPAAQAKVSVGKQEVSADCQMQVVRDSMLTISVMPMLGIEMLRVEATPDSICVIDKLNRRYAISGYQEINQVLSPHITWADLQAIASGEAVGSTNEWLSHTYSAQGHTLTLSIRYNDIQRNAAVRISRLKTARYTKVDPKTLLQQ